MYRIMRMLVMFDLPVTTSRDKKNYRVFKKFLTENGYAMLQYSVYAKIILNHSSLQYQKKKIHQHIPPEGQVDILVITEKQFANIETFHKRKQAKEQITTSERIVEL